MSRSKRDILETENMLQRLTDCLRKHLPAFPTDNTPGQCRADAESLRRISMTLQRWHELECGDSNPWNSFCITRGHKIVARVVQEGNALAVRQTTFEHDDNGKPYLEIHHNSGGTSYQAIPDREVGARKRLAKILARYPGLTAYVQTDPRGCALYILRDTDIPQGGEASAYYTRGIAVHQ